MSDAEFTERAAALQDFARELDRIECQASADGIDVNVGPRSATITLQYDDPMEQAPERMTDGGREFQSSGRRRRDPSFKPSPDPIRPDADRCSVHLLDAVKCLDDARAVAPRNHEADVEDRLKSIDSQCWSLVHDLVDALGDDDGNGGDDGD